MTEDINQTAPTREIAPYAAAGASGGEGKRAKKEAWSITFVAAPGRWPMPAQYRVRGLLRSALRGWGLRAVDISGPEGGKQQIGKRRKRA